MSTNAPEASVHPEIGTLALTDLKLALVQGWRDFLKAPLFGLFFSSFYVICGLALSAAGAGAFVWTLVLSLGFPLVAPFAAVGLYEVSRRLGRGEPLIWSEVLAIVWAERGRQIPWVGAILVIVFLFWSFFAHMSLALFFGNMTLTNVNTSWEVFNTTTGRLLIGFELLAGAVVAFLVYALTVVSLPLLLEREVDFVSAMLISIRTVLHNRFVMLVWAAIIAALILLAMVPLFLGLLLVLPVLGHATWHLYQKALVHP